MTRIRSRIQSLLSRQGDSALSKSGPSKASRKVGSDLSSSLSSKGRNQRRSASEDARELIELGGPRHPGGSRDGSWLKLEDGGSVETAIVADRNHGIAETYGQDLESGLQARESKIPPSGIMVAQQMKSEVSRHHA